MTAYERGIQEGLEIAAKRMEAGAAEWRTGCGAGEDDKLAERNRTREDCCLMYAAIFRRMKDKRHEKQP